jgi:hypothetical protein
MTTTPASQSSEGARAVSPRKDRRGAGERLHAPKGGVEQLVDFSHECVPGQVAQSAAECGMTFEATTFRRQG